MAQVLKDSIRDDIIESAREEFLENGYDRSSMRRIAQRSRITVGNLYRYFKSKEDLNEIIVSKTYEEINKVLQKVTGDVVSIGKDVSGVPFSLDELSKMMNSLVDGLMKVYEHHRIELNILMMESRLNEQITSWFAGLIARLIGENYDVDHDSSSVKTLARSYAIAIFHGLKSMFKETDTDIETLTNMVRIYLNSFVNILRQDLAQLEGK